MIENPPATLEEAIRQSGEGWLIDWHSPASEAIPHLLQVLGEVARLAKDRLGDDAPDLSETALIAESRRNSRRIKGFFQALGGSCTPTMLLMAWRIIQGMEIKSIQLTHLRQRSFQAQVVLESPHGSDEEVYVSTNINDFEVFRHMAILQVDASPVLDGFYPLRGLDKDRIQ